MGTDGQFTQVADRVWVARHAWLDVNVVAVAGSRGLLLVDTLGSAAAARRMLDRLRGVSRAPVVGVVNTHEHFDHTFGNGTVRDVWPGVSVHAHKEAAARTAAAGQRAKEEYAAGDDPYRDEVLATEIVAADTTLSSVRVIDLGDHGVELVHPGRGHTAGDLVVRVADADVVVAGDLVEESAPPAYGPDSFPLDWPAALDMVLQLVGPATVVVPGHGAPVGRDFVQQQRADIGVVAETVHDLVSRAVPLADAVRHADWPFPPEAVEQAVRRGYEHVPRTARRLPLL